MSGRQVVPATTFMQARAVIDVSGLPEGVYVLSGIGSGGVSARRFVVAR